MAMILDAFASSLGDILIETMKEEASLMLGVSDEIRKLYDTLNSLKKFLQDAEKKHITSSYAQDWVRKLKGAMYEASDITDLVQIKAEERRISMDTSSGCFHSFLLCLQDPLFAHRIGSQIKSVNQKMDDLCKQAAQLNFITNLTDGNGKHKVIDKTAPGLVPRDAVGKKLEQDTRMLVEVLTKEEKASGGESNNVHVVANSDTESNNVTVVAILGIGGIGKTTLAKKIYSDQAVEDSFNTKIWLSVTQDFNEVDLLRTAIVAAGGDHCGAQEKSLLEPILVSALTAKKFLLVMDDIWNQKPWEKVLRVPTIKAGARGSRVLITTRNEGVAREMNAVHLHHVSKLGPQDAWAMLKEQLDLSGPETKRLKESGMKIVEKCDGLPLAIKVVGGVLCKRNKTENDWEKVLGNQVWSKIGLPDELNKAIYLSYEDLVPNLKQCFVYYSLFPKDEIIGPDKVVAMWTAEGFLGNDGNSTQLGMDYYKELIMRNLLEPHDDYYNQEYCLMHDVVRSFAQYVARDEALVVGDTENMTNLTLSNFFRLSISANEIEWSNLQKRHSLRTLLLFGNIKFKPGNSLSNLPFLRTIHIRDARCATLIGSLCHLKHLRYLELGYTNISALPQNIGKMKFLEHIGLRGCHSLAELPSSITELPKLRHLSIDETKINAIPRGFKRLENLEMLWGFPVHIIIENTGEYRCSLEELGPLSKLRKLKLIGLENVPYSSMATLAKLKTKENLICLELWCTSGVTVSGRVKESIAMADQEQIVDVFDKLCPPLCLEELTIGGYFGDKLPSWIMMPAKFLKNMRRLDLQDMANCAHLPSGLGQLQDLDCLVINRAPQIEQVGYDFFVQGGQRKTDNRNPSHAVFFPKLHELCLQGMIKWKEWTWEKHVEAMPVLSVLNIRNCKLHYLPPGLSYQAKALRRLSIANVQHLNCLENFSSVIKLDAYDNPDLERIANLPNMQNLTVVGCPKLMVFNNVKSLRSIQLGISEMETLPAYLQDTKLEQLEIACSLKLLKLMVKKESWSEWGKISNIMHVKGFASENGRRWYISYTKHPFSFDTNIEYTLELPGYEANIAMEKI
ncbi:putative disease resistance protein RGA3 isoform X2 [Oryza glaberrima]|uniref:putative disease resistance protein RGA3 isoform X2 n=1 Tax=Oryza glaberrima TaxID=4538 RepID=UPI00224C585E|nr:putative disease resistance protein RGA3 isoform X2 [Oryza glaberrima]